MIEEQQPEQRILVIDDNPDIHKDYRKILVRDEETPEFSALNAFFGEEREEPVVSRPKVRLDSAYQGEEGLQMVKDAAEKGQPYAMAFVDMRMPPGWDGLQTVEEIWKVAPDMQVVICTAYSDNTWDEIIGRIGRSDKLLILKKPFDRIEVNQLAVALTEKWALANKARMRQEDLEHLVQQRTVQLQEAALRDPLTRLGNRAMFHEALTKALRRHKDSGTHAAICLIDLDRFKQVNDRLGHMMGDQLLIAVARRLESCFRSVDTIARLGGDEFAILCEKEDSGPNHNAHLTSESLQRIQDAMCQPYEVEGQRILCGSSMGVALIPGDGVCAEEVLYKADLALYLAKNVGRGRLCMFDAAAKSSLIANRELGAELTQAIEQNQFELYYQPLVNSVTSKTECFEALVRWPHPQRGLVLPCDFIAAAEHGGQIIQLGEWVLHKACRDAMQWDDSIKVSVNVSAVQFRGDKLEKIVHAALTESGLAPERLEIEITETVAFQDYDETMKRLDVLREIGVRIALDDFGTGHSSLSYLRQFHFDKLKLDKSFVSDALHSDEDRLILKAVAGLGKSLGIDTTAEGVESEAQRELVRREGYSQMQGFLFGRPMPSSALPEYFEREAAAQEAQSSLYACVGG